MKHRLLSLDKLNPVPPDRIVRIQVVPNRMVLLNSTLTQSELRALLPRIQKVLKTGRPWKDDGMHHPATAIITAVLSIKGMTTKCDENDSDGFSTNGWQWDWWQRFTYNDKDYTLSGSGYYGGHAFNLSDVL